MGRSPLASSVNVLTSDCEGLTQALSGIVGLRALHLSLRLLFVCTNSNKRLTSSDMQASKTGSAFPPDDPQAHATQTATTLLTVDAIRPALDSESPRAPKRQNLALYPSLSRPILRCGKSAQVRNYHGATVGFPPTKNVIISDFSRQTSPISPRIFSRG